MKIGLFFGSFNPMHIGHKIIACHMLEFTDLDQVCFVVSPQNPLKNKKSLLNQHHRLMIIKTEIEDNPKLSVSDIEFNLPYPSYTIDTLTYLQEQKKDNEYVLIMGTDNLKTINKWKNYEQILNNYYIYAYPRKGSKVKFIHKNINIINDVPEVEISASFIRNSIKNQKAISHLVPHKAWKYIDEMNFYKNIKHE